MADVNIKVSIVSAQAERGLDRITARAKGTERELKKVTVGVKNLGGAFNVFLGNVAANAITALGRGLSSFAGNVFDATVQAEQLRTRLETLTGSAEVASDVFRQLTTFAAGTPFQLTEIADATNQLIAFGFETTEITTKLNEIGDVAAASGGNIKDLSLIFGQVAAAGKLTGERLLQLQERAIPIGPAIAKTLGIAESQVRDFVSKGLVDFDKFEEAFRSLSDEGGFAFNGLEKQSQTLGGQLSNLEDNFTLLATAVGDKLSPVFKVFLSILNETLGGLTRFVNQFSTDEVTAEVAKLDTQIIKLQNSLTQTAVTGGGILGVSANEITQDSAAIQAELDALIAKRKELLTPSSGDGGSTEDVAAQLRKTISIEKTIREQAAEEERQRLGEEEAIKVAKREEDLASLEQFYNDRAEIEAQNEILLQQATLKAQLTTEQQEKIINDKRLANKKAFADASKKIEDQQLKDQQTFLNTSSSLASSQNKTLAAIGKASAVAQIAIKTPEAVASSFAFGARIGGPPLGFVFGGIAAAAMAAQAARVAGLNFQDGGVVPGNSFSGDRVAANVNSGEVILNRQQQAQTLFAIANGQGGGERQPTEIVIENKIELDGEQIFNSVSRQVADGRELGEVV